MTKVNLTDLIQKDLPFFQMKVTPESVSTAKLPVDLLLARPNEELSGLYQKPGKNDLCQKSMADADNIICQTASALLSDAVGNKAEAWDFMDEIMDAVSAHYRGMKFPPNCKAEFLVNYLANQAYAIAAHWHAKNTAKNARWSGRLPAEYRDLVDVKYQAFQHGLIPVGTQTEGGKAKLLVWKPWCIK